MYVGVDYYPEHWPQERWAKDAGLMRKAGLNIVRMAEFAWVQMEPDEGHFKFGWLDEALELLHKRGISAILGTPTATMPAWVARKYPETLAMKTSGTREIWGVRKNNCFSSGTYRLLSERITRAMAQHFVANPAVIGWQTDNEFAPPVCYCPSCQATFQDWVRARYKTLDAVNKAWGTHFWSHRYGQWNEIIAPENSGCYNPSLCLDWNRFHSDQNVRFQRDQVRILREVCPQHFITHNFMGFHSDLNNFDMAADLDFVSWDNYPVWGAPEISYEPGAAADVMRGLKTKNFWIMEQTSGPGGWGSFGRNPQPGEMRKIAFQQLGHGADSQLFFRWRACTAGREQYWHGVIGHDGQPLRRYQELSQIAHDLHAVAAEMEGTTPRNDVAMIYDYETIWALRIQPCFDKNKFHDDLMRYYRASFRAGVGVDMIPSTADLSKYRVVVAPELYVLSDEVAQKLARFVRGGGTLLADLRLGVKTETNLCHTRTLPGLLSGALGIRIEEYESLNAPMEYAVRGEGLPGKFTAHQFADWVTAEKAEVLAGYETWPMQSFAAATRNSFGRGFGYYLGTVIKEESFYDALMGAVLASAGIKPALTPPAGVEVCWREGAGKRLAVLINHVAESREVEVPAGARELLSGTQTEKTLTLDKYGVAVLKL